ncbi:exonuclease V subunit alpha [Mycolicibacterium fortuitum]|nr:exonuclease V subunit alpha [Mycolicibacterium fortuitum]OBK63336.1 exonuclease V subunit alpha [Mycolicibacterium fortuitum]OCB48680.1 exonuclease V subunit alpha [Mycolicibacterium vulneris]
MTVSMHKISSGDGYLYLVRQVAASDATHRGRSTLSDYYSVKGEAPGQWMGSGLAALSQPSTGLAMSEQTITDVWTVAPGSEVTEDQMKALFGEGIHPNASKITKYLTARGAGSGPAQKATKLGGKFRIYADPPFVAALSQAYQDHNVAAGLSPFTKLEPDVKATIKTELARAWFVEEYGRPPGDDRELSGYIARIHRPAKVAVAAYDLACSPVKSFSAMWAVAPLPVAQILEDCHHAAVKDVLAEIERSVALTRMGTNGAAQVDTEGVIATAWTHRDSRAGDPDLHTHLVISAKVSTIDHNGVRRWLSLDGQPLHHMMVSLSELYNTRLEHHTTQRLGWVFAETEAPARGKRPVREIVGVPTELLKMWSSRRAAIETRTAELAKEFQNNHGREPTAIELLDLSQQATLETREAKHDPMSLAEQRAKWRTQAVELVGHRGLAAMLREVNAAKPEQVQKIDQEWVHSAADSVIAVVAEGRAHWQRHHVLAEAQRYVRTRGYAAIAPSDLVERITETALSEPFSVPHARVGDTDVGEPKLLRRRDGTSVYHRHGRDQFTSKEMRAAEQRIITAARATGSRRASQTDIDLALADSAARGKPLNAGQQALVQEMAAGDRQLILALAPAGSGKTTAMAALSHAWRSSGGNVIGLAPTAVAAIELAADLNAETDTVAKYVHTVAGETLRNGAAPKRGRRPSFSAALSAAYQQHNAEAGRDRHAALPDEVKAAIKARVQAEYRDSEPRVPSWFHKINAKTMIIIDEVGKAGTLDLDAVIAHAQAKGACIRTVGDDGQLASPSAGGVLRDIAHETDTLTLSELVRFRSESEAAATLALRAGDPAALGFYIDHHRVHVGADSTAADMAYSAWRSDMKAGRDSLLLAPTNEVVDELNARARRDRLADAGITRIGREAILSDGLAASAGDIIKTRKNSRWLSIGPRDFVRNGYRYRIERICTDGSLVVTHLGSKKRLTLPADYVSRDVTLGYASTVDLAQGLTAGHSCHIVGAAAMTRQLLYVALTRGRAENHIYLSTSEQDPHRILSTKVTHPETAVEALSAALARDGAQVSATTADREARDPFGRLAAACDMYYDAVITFTEHRLGAAALARLDDGVAAIRADIPECAAWPALRGKLATMALQHGVDETLRLYDQQLHRRELRSAGLVAAVMHYRMESIDPSPPGPLRWLSPIPDELRTEPEVARYLQRRHDLVTDLAEQIRVTCATWTASTTPVWAKAIWAASPALATEIAVFRAAHGVADTDTRLTGPRAISVRSQKIQSLLEERAIGEIGRQAPQLAQFDELVDSINPRIRADSYWPQLAARLVQAAKIRADLPALLTEATRDAPLPDELPAAALWWRISPVLSPTALDTTHSHLRPTWISDLHEVFGSAAAEAITADIAWPALVGAVATVDSRHWSPRDLLHLAAEHLADADAHAESEGAPRIGTHEYARLITYSVEFLTHAAKTHDTTIPTPEHPPLSPEEEELAPPDLAESDLHLEHQPDPVDANRDLREPGPDIEPVPDPRSPATDEFSGLQFHELSTTRPAPPLAPALANVHALRSEYLAATTEYTALAGQCQHGQGPAVIANTDRIRDMRDRADADRPYLDAVIDVTEQWADSEARYDQATRAVARAREHYERLSTDPDADSGDVDSARWHLQLLESEVPDTTPAEKYYPLLTAAQAARAHAAGGPDNVVSHADVDTYLAGLRSDDDHTLAAKRAALAELRADLSTAEAETARAYADAETRTAEHITDNLELLHTELRVLETTTNFDPTRPLPVTAQDLAGLSPDTASALTAIAHLPFTVTPVRALPSPDTTNAMRALHHAASAQDRKVLWCAPTPQAADTARADQLADTVATLAHTHAQIIENTWTLPTGSLIVIDDAATARPQVLADLIDAAHEARAGVILLDTSTQAWPPQPSTRLMALLQTDIPWAHTLDAPKVYDHEHHTRSVLTQGPLHSRVAPDLDPILAQAERVQPHLLDDHTRAAIRRRHDLRAANRNAYKRHQQITALHTSPTEQNIARDITDQ